MEVTKSVDKSLFLKPDNQHHSIGLIFNWNVERFILVCTFIANQLIIFGKEKHHGTTYSGNEGNDFNTTVFPGNSQQRRGS